VVVLVVLGFFLGGKVPVLGCGHAVAPGRDGATQQRARHGSSSH